MFANNLSIAIIVKNGLTGMPTSVPSYTHTLIAANKSNKGNFFPNKGFKQFGRTATSHTYSYYFCWLPPIATLIYPYKNHQCKCTSFFIIDYFMFEAVTDEGNKAIGAEHVLAVPVLRFEYIRNNQKHKLFFVFDREESGESIFMYADRIFTWISSTRNWTCWIHYGVSIIILCWQITKCFSQ